MRRPLRLALAVLIAAVLATACAAPSADDQQAVARAAGEPVTDVATLPRPSSGGVEAQTSSGEREGTRPDVEPFTCPFDTEGLTAVDCGRVEMPGRGEDPNYTVSLVFARFYATGDADQLRADPVVYLHGGPGGAIVESAPFWYDSIVEPHISQRDVILYDQRGGGRSTTLPVCHEVNDVGDRFYTDAVAHEELASAYIDRLADCATKFVERTSVDTTAFNSAINAQDLVDLMWALDIDTYNLHGSSYGSRLAQTIMRDAPEGVRSVTLSGVYPIDANLMGSIPQSIETALDAVFAGCAADEECSVALPDPWQALEDLVTELDAAPLPVEVPTTAAEQFTIAFDGTDLINGLHDLLYVGSNAATVPDMLIDHVDGDSRRIERLARNSVFDHTGIATFLLVQCADEAPFTTAENLNRPIDHEFLRAVDLAPAINGVDALTICEAWNTGTPDPAENTAVTWDAPTLIFAGAVDPITPPKWAEQLAASLPRSRLIQRADASHDSDEGGCALGIIARFVEDPDLVVESGCSSRDTNLPIYTDAVRFADPTTFFETELDVGGTEISLDVPDWIGDWNDDVHLRWRALDVYDPTAVIVLPSDSTYALVDHLPFYGTIPGWNSDAQSSAPDGWYRSVMSTTGGDLIRYRSTALAVDVVLVREPDEIDDLESDVLLPVIASIVAAS